MNKIYKLKNIILNIFRNKNKRITFFTYIILPIVINLFIEIFSRKSVIKGFIFPFTHPVPFLCNALIILMTLMISTFFRRRVFLLTLITFVWIFLGFVNFTLLCNRVTPFNATDILLMGPAIAVIRKYYSNVTIGFVIGAIVLILFFIVYLWFKAPKLQYKVNYIRNAVVSIIVVIVTFSSLSIAIDTGFISVKFDNIANAYNKYGFAYCFSNSIFNTGVSKPDDYSAETIEKIVSETETETEMAVEASAQVSNTPNIIFVQLESFFDLNRYKDLVLSQNPVPNFEQLKEQYPSGYFEVPIVGAGTANTEFEVLTGMNIDDFGPGEYPYKTILQSTTCESISYDLKENGYSTHAIHNNAGTFYQRHTVFSQLGFDTFTPIEYMNNLEFTYKHWAKDNVLTGEILKCLNSTQEKDFIFTVSVEGHGSYPGSQVLDNPEITVQQIGNEGSKYATEYYANLLYDMDKFIADLTNTLSAYNEDVILVLYGDHLPSLGLSDSKLNSGTTYQTEYIIWNNMNLNISDEDIEAYQISSKIMQLIGVDTGLINKYHQTHKGDEEYLNGLQNLEYDLLYGDKTAYKGINPYIASNLQMGIDKIKITQILSDSENPDSLIIKGENFTNYSVVYVNGEKFDTEFIDNSTLRIQYPDLTYQDTFKVGQQGSDNIVLSYTDEYIYY